MQKTFVLIVIPLICLAAQLLFLEIFGFGLVPNFVLIAVVFFNLSRGLNMSLAAAFIGGFLLDCFSGNTLGINTFTLVFCAFITGSIKMYIYQPGVAESRVLMIFLIALINGFLQYFTNLAMGVDLRFAEAFARAILPEVLLTAFVANYTLERLKECALKLFV